jgi:hypothetical protein
MTGALDAEMRQVAVDLTGELGKALTVRENTGSTYDPATGTNTVTYTDHAVNGAVRSYSERLIDGGSVQVGDLEVTLPAQSLSFEPDTQDKVTLDGEDWSIVNAARAYGDQVIVYRLQVRK